MQITVYADVIFFLNFFIDFIILEILNFFRTEKKKNIKIFLGGIIGGLLGTFFSLMFIKNSLINIVFGFIAVFLTVAFTFYPLKKRELFVLSIFLYILSFLLGGITEYLIQYFKYFSLKILCISTILFYFLIYGINGFLKTKILDRNRFSEIEVIFNNKSIKLTALIDTGNSLREKNSGLPVIIAEFYFIETIFNLEEKVFLYEYFEKKREFEANSIFKEIPFNSLGKRNGIIIGFKPEKVKIFKDKAYKETDAYIGIYENRLTYKNGYNAIIGYDAYNVTGV